MRSKFFFLRSLPIRDAKFMCSSALANKQLKKSRTHDVLFCCWFAVCFVKYKNVNRINDRLGSRLIRQVSFVVRVAGHSIHKRIAIYRCSGVCGSDARAAARMVYWQPRTPALNVPSIAALSHVTVSAIGWRSHGKQCVNSSRRSNSPFASAPHFNAVFMFVCRA